MHLNVDGWTDPTWLRRASDSGAQESDYIMDLGVGRATQMGHDYPCLSYYISNLHVIQAPGTSYSRVVFDGDFAKSRCRPPSRERNMAMTRNTV